ncbi:MAG: LytR C-terminal domain-containing protein [candidate division Zixibacteria bacterium]|nr:LytR C-terminal domain-containing protein [candidate division Zixibacteria bacterium]
MVNKSSKSKGSSAYRIKRAKRKKPIRFLEIAILFLFVVVAVYVISFSFQLSRGYSQERDATEFYINLQVLNGCGEKGIANKLANLIEVSVEKPLAVRVIDTDNFDNFGVEKTFVISRKSDLKAANILARQLNLENAVTYREIDDNYLDIGATLILGKDYREVFELPDRK